VFALAEQTNMTHDSLTTDVLYSAASSVSQERMSGVGWTV